MSTQNANGVGVRSDKQAKMGPMTWYLWPAYYRKSTRNLGTSTSASVARPTGRGRVTVASRTKAAMSGQWGFDMA